jgi:hypothetical protein
MKKFMRESRYTVLKNSDIDKFLTGTEFAILCTLCKKINQGRLYTRLPEKGDECWWQSCNHISAEHTRAEVFASYVKGDEDWQTFKMDRPE